VAAVRLRGVPGNRGDRAAGRSAPTRQAELPEVSPRAVLAALVACVDQQTDRTGLVKFGDIRKRLGKGRITTSQTASLGAARPG
jgi:hypothetical protein